MQVQLDVPEDIARQLAADQGSLARAALEALALEGVRSGKLTVHQAGVMLGISSRNAMDGFLKAHGVYLPLTAQDVIADGETAADFAR